jgi:septal ring factor EnvC (AmiA/AmiB activator)
MSEPIRQQRIRHNRATLVISYVMGIVGIGSLAAVFLLLYDFDRRQSDRAREVAELQRELEAVQKELGVRQQDDNVISNRLQDLENRVNENPDGRLIADSRSTAPGGDENSQLVQQLRDELVQQQSRFADLEAKARDYERIEGESRRMSEELTSLRKQLEQFQAVADNYETLRRQFDQQAERLVATTNRLDAFKKQLDERPASRTVVRNPTVYRDSFDTTTRVIPSTGSTPVVGTSSLPEITSFPPAGGTVSPAYGGYSETRVITSYPPSRVVVPSGH